ncbi:glycoside hydrolase family 65 protein [Acidipropionibacterium virtanenii]|uniref:Alpha,alpha-trehalose phosphorylase n=1 Tax=Acidipropionibacterium virtanenii TaxID=2057246 RepID=A0A344UQN0_9ACTN|nr:glycosyl hydrolase family 65 protein [Acidipropionibacterium virtanenii]AXE37578.1 Alpha,alpha-trehalose phosphorylase [Acidipropionibacterium virtanenii]
MTTSESSTAGSNDDPLDRLRYPIDPWALRETLLPEENARSAETLFAVGNGYLGIRGTSIEGYDAATAGTYVNGFHETYPIHHAEEAYGFARVGQEMIAVPDATVMRLYAGDEPLHLPVADLEQYERRLDLRTGVLTRTIVWRAPSKVRVRVSSRRMVSFTRPHLAVMEIEITPLDGELDLTVVSTLVNRLDAQTALAEGAMEGGQALDTPLQAELESHIPDPRKSSKLGSHVLESTHVGTEGSCTSLGYRVAASGMTLAVGVDHDVSSDDEVRQYQDVSPDVSSREFRTRARAGSTLRIVKYAAYHTSRSSPSSELAQRCRRTIGDARAAGLDTLLAEQRAWCDGFWARSDVEVAGRPELQQAIRFNLFHVAQATMCGGGHGIPAKGLTGNGYSGHYFWDGEVYVLPFLSYTTPEVSRSALRFRCTMLPAARRRAHEINMTGALFPWRTINGHEASGNYAQGTAQYHIDADISYALMLYVRTTGDHDFLTRGAIDILVETARMWADLGFFRSDGQEAFHIHGVTGPDEYTTVVDDNLYTNIMARGNLRDAVAAVRSLQAQAPERYARMVDRVGLDPSEVDLWERAAEAMAIPYDEKLQVHPQDDRFLTKEVWDLPHTPPSDFPLLLHYHPLMIYRFQVIKQTDVVLAELLHSSEFAADEKARDFHYYEPLTTGDSSLSAVAEAIMAAEVGHPRDAVRHFQDLLFVDLADTHHNTDDGIHIASAGGVWSALIYGFGGLRDDPGGGRVRLDPRLPSDWEGLTFRITVRGTRVRVELAGGRITLSVEEGPGTRLVVCGSGYDVSPGAPVTIRATPHEDLGPMPTLDDIVGQERADGTIITPRLPSHSAHH